MLPKVAPMDSRSSKPTSYALTPSEPAVVVPCPSCDTKFAVESSLIAAIEKPKFHCSRCDAVFGMPATLAKHLHTPTVSSGGTGAEARSESHANQSFVRDNYSLSEQRPRAGLQASDFSLAARSTPNERAVVREERIPTPQSIARREEPLREVKPLSVAPREIEPQATQQRELSPLGASSNEASQPEQPSNPHQRKSRYDIDELLAHSARLQDETPQRMHKPVTTDPLAERPHHERTAEQQRPTHRPERVKSSPTVSHLWQGGALISIPLFGTLAALVGFSYFAYLAPATSTTIARVLIPSFLRGAQPQLPPSELLVKGLSVRFEKTQTKEVVPVIRGTLVNGGEQPLDGVVLQGLGFDQNGEVVLDARAPLRSALSREQIGDLPLVTVQKFQASLNARTSSIQPGEQVPFTVALLSKRSAEGEGVDGEGALKAMKFFSARVFSTR